MKKGLRVVAFLPAIIFILLGFGWWINPAFVGEQLGMTLLYGVGLSTQIADLAAFFLTLGSCILIGLFTRKRFWFYPAIMLLGIAAFGRVLAWLFHSAPLAYDMIIVEATVIVLLLFLDEK